MELSELVEHTHGQIASLFRLFVWFRGQMTVLWRDTKRVC